MTVQKSITTGNIWSIISTAAGVAVILVSVVMSYASVSSKALENERTLVAQQLVITDLQRSVRVLELAEARGSERYDALSRSMEELKAAQRETNELLRQMQRQPSRTEGR